jgi:cysteine-rich repeat protein
VLATGLAALIAAAPAGADSVKCRGGIGKNVSKVISTGFKSADSCHKGADKASTASGQCNHPGDPAFDPKGKYGSTKTKATAAIDKVCTGDAVTGNYPGGNIEGSLYPLIDQSIAGDSGLLLGVDNLGGDKAKTKCLEGIAKNRTAVINGIIKNSVKCQSGKDKEPGAVFGPIDPLCVDDGAAAIAKAVASINSACKAPITGGDVGSCSPLPDCVTEEAKAAGQQLARDIYFPGCGNGVVEGSEQCDDGNLTDGDGCNHLCESELSTCTPPGSPNAHRLVQVDISTPTPLAGLRVDLTYPVFEASVPGFGDSSVVRDRLMVLQAGGISAVNDNDFLSFTIGFAGATNFINSGPLFKVDFDNCVPLSENICNRTKNVTGCSLNPKRCTCLANSDCGTGGTCASIDGSVTKFCTAGDPLKQSCVDVGDAACTAGFVCDFDPAGPSNPPLCKPGHFPSPQHPLPFVVGTDIGPCDGTSSGPPHGCGGDNVCVSQTDATACTVTDPVDANVNPISGVTCTVTITEAP